MSELYNTWKGRANVRPIVGQQYKCQKYKKVIIGELLNNDKEFAHLRDNKGLIHIVLLHKLESTIPIEQTYLIGWIYKTKTKIGVLLSNDTKTVELRDCNGKIHKVARSTLKMVLPA